MKLTKKMELLKQFLNEEEYTELLKNQEDADEWNHWRKELPNVTQWHEIVERLKKLNLEGHIIFLKHYIKSLPIAYDLAAIENILYDLKEIQKILGEKHD